MHADSKLSNKESSLHHYRTEIPNVSFDLLDPFKFFLYVNYFFFGISISLADWKYFYAIGMAEKFERSEEEIIKIIKSKTAQSMHDANRTCEWCLGSTLVLHSHHHPIQRSLGGTETVDICPNCHYEFHFLCNSAYRFKNEYCCVVVKK